MSKRKQVVNCPYCKELAHLMTGDQLYDHRPDLHYLFFWVCKPCDAWVGCHKNSPTHHPLGRLASAKLRKWKQEAHRTFDLLWKKHSMTRTEAYVWLANVLNLDVRTCHIAMFSVMNCQKTIVYSQAWIDENAKWQKESIDLTQQMLAAKAREEKKK